MSNVLYVCVHQLNCLAFHVFFVGVPEVAVGAPVCQRCELTGQRAIRGSHATCKLDGTQRVHRFNGHVFSGTLHCSVCTAEHRERAYIVDYCRMVQIVRITN